MMTARQNRKVRRAAERDARRQQISNSALSASAAWHDEAALLSEPKTQADDEAAFLSEPKTQADDEAAFLSEPKTQADDEAALLSEPKTQDPAEDRTASPAVSSVSPARLAANRANAQLSTGPNSESGKIRASKNALKTALTGRTVLLPEDDADRYEQHLLHYRKAYQPVGERECELVQSLADTTWRIDRIPGLEEALYFKGCHEFASQVAELDPRARINMLRMHTLLAYERQFRNLHVQEMRLHRLREKLIAEIKQLQKEREEKEKDELAMSAKLYIAAKHDGTPFDPSDFGFEFSTADVEAYLHGQRASLLTEKALTAGGA